MKQINSVMTAQHKRPGWNAGILARLFTFTVSVEATPTRPIAILALAAAANFFVLARIADAAAASVQRLPATAIIRFAGTSTLHDFEGTLPPQPFVLILSNGTWSADSDVLAGQMNTGNVKRDCNMHQMLATNSFPKLHGTIVAAPVPGISSTNATLQLKIRDKSHSLPVHITAWTEDARHIQFHAVWELSLDDYALKPPSVLGVIRVGDRIKLEANITADKTVSPSTP